MPYRNELVFLILSRFIGIMGSNIGKNEFSVNKLGVGTPTGNYPCDADPEESGGIASHPEASKSSGEIDAS